METPSRIEQDLARLFNTRGDLEEKLGEIKRKKNKTPHDKTRIKSLNEQIEGIQEEISSKTAALQRKLSL